MLTRLLCQQMKNLSKLEVAQRRVYGFKNEYKFQRAQKRFYKARARKLDTRIDDLLVEQADRVKFLNAEINELSLEVAKWKKRCEEADGTEPEA